MKACLPLPIFAFISSSVQPVAKTMLPKYVAVFILGFGLQECLIFATWCWLYDFCLVNTDLRTCLCCFLGLPIFLGLHVLTFLWHQTRSSAKSRSSRLEGPLDSRFCHLLWFPVWSSQPPLERSKVTASSLVWPLFASQRPLQTSLRGWFGLKHCTRLLKVDGIPQCWSSDHRTPPSTLLYVFWKLMKLRHSIDCHFEERSGPYRTCSLWIQPFSGQSRSSMASLVVLGLFLSKSCLGQRETMSDLALSPVSLLGKFH